MTKPKKKSATQFNAKSAKQLVEAFEKQMKSSAETSGDLNTVLNQIQKAASEGKTSLRFVIDPQKTFMFHPDVVGIQQALIGLGFSAYITNEIYFKPFVYGIYSAKCVKYILGVSWTDSTW